MIFAGFIVGFYYNNMFYRYTTYRNTIIKDIQFDSNTLRWKLEKRDLLLALTIEKGLKPGLLYTPDENDMIPKVNEYLDGAIRYQLYQNNSKIFDDRSNSCATEFIGDTSKLIEMALK